ncbi:hypothetical protein [Streptacidiphilus sp. MAP5-52]|uniref:hypothetical protein n=1 Tax=Streptacidiphilus sp. MAP5-52 TaxID=3156267 RepID=UPI003513A85B
MPRHQRSRTTLPTSTEVGSTDSETIQTLVHMAAPQTAVILLSAARHGAPRHAAAYDASGRRLALKATLCSSLAKWITARFPGLDPHRAYSLQLSTGRLATVADEHTKAA